MGPTSAGELKDRVLFERRAPLADGYGNGEGAWAALVGPRQVRLQPSRGGEQVVAQRLQGVSAWDLWVRFDAQIARVVPGDRVVDARDPGRTFAVKFAEDMDGRRRWILMQVELGTAS